MNKSRAKKIAEKITYEQLKAMFDNAQIGISDWTKTSTVNKGMTKGAVWNILQPGLKPEIMSESLALKNMIWEFGDFLDDVFEDDDPKSKAIIKVHHQEPVFHKLNSDEWPF